MKTVSSGQMRHIDERTIRGYGIPSIVLMENAGISCAEEALRVIHCESGRAVVFSGKGNNGGDGFVAARHLFNKGIRVSVFFFQPPEEMRPDPFINYTILRKMKVPMTACYGRLPLGPIKRELGRCDVVVDALFGTGLTKKVEGNFKGAIERMNAAEASILSVDVPSGLNADTGQIMGACVFADITVALAAPKRGFYLKDGPRTTGKVIVREIGRAHV